jgi:hypothetical protein
MMASAANRLVRTYAVQAKRCAGAPEVRIEHIHIEPDARAVFENIQAQKMNDEVATELHWVLVEGPGPGDAEFLGRWLLAAVEADEALQEQFKRNPKLKEQIGRLEVICEVSFSPAVMRFVELLMKNLTAFSLELWDEWGEIFTVMAELGFFCLTGNRYQMTIPRTISGSSIEAALLRLAAAEDQNYFLHPEHLVTCLTEPEAKAWQLRLECLSWIQRVADRSVLLGEGYA